MQRSLAILVLLILNWITLLPALAAPAASNVPVCCRNNGKHRCQMKPSAVFSALGEKCPFSPQSSVISPMTAYQVATRQAVFAGLLAHPADCPQTEAGYRASHYRARQKRGPPALRRS